MSYKYISLIIVFFSFLLSDEYTGYVRQVEMSFCMDECAEYYLEDEYGQYIGNIMSTNTAINLNMYIDRFVNINADEEYWCVECGAYIVEDIEFSYDCEQPVSCFMDPCDTVLCEPGYECYSDYCGGCYADCLELEQDCIDFSNLDFGMCDMFLGYGWVGDGCEGLSGCGWNLDGIDYSEYFFNSELECEASCSDGFVNCAEDEIEINDLCFNALDVAYIQEMIDNSYASNIDLGCEDWDNYCGSPNPYMDSPDNWGWISYDGATYQMSGNDNGIVEPLELGIQEWQDGRLTNIMCGAYIYCQLSGDVPEIQEGQLTEIEQFRFEYNYLSGYVPESVCDLQLNDNDYLEFDLSGNYLCPPYPECIEGAIGYQNTMDCVEINLGDINSDGQINVIDVVLLVSFILQQEVPSETQFLASDFNQDGSLNVLDVVDIVAMILQGEEEEVLPEECNLEPDSGNCFGSFTMYYFNSLTNTCEEFIWGGCGGIVPFENLLECQDSCE